MIKIKETARVVNICGIALFVFFLTTNFVWAADPPSERGKLLGEAVDPYTGETLRTYKQSDGTLVTTRTDANGNEQNVEKQAETPKQQAVENKEGKLIGESVDSKTGETIKIYKKSDGSRVTERTDKNGNRQTTVTPRPKPKEDPWKAFKEFFDSFFKPKKEVSETEDLPEPDQKEPSPPQDTQNETPEQEKLCPDCIPFSEVNDRIGGYANLIEKYWKEMRARYAYGNAPKTLREEFERRGITGKNFLEGTTENWGNNSLAVSYNNCAEDFYQHHWDALNGVLAEMKSRGYAYSKDVEYFEKGFKKWISAELELNSAYYSKVKWWAGESAYWGWQNELVVERRNKFYAARPPATPLTDQEQAQLDAFDQEYKQNGEKQKAANDEQSKRLDPIIDKFCAHPHFFEARITPDSKSNK